MEDNINTAAETFLAAELLNAARVSDLKCSKPRIEEFLWLPHSVVFWKDTERLTNWGDHPIHKKGDRSECINHLGISLLSLPRKVYAKCLEALKKDDAK